MAIYGNAGSLSSLLSAASAARKRQESLQDSIASYEWDLSPKTVEDYSKYSKLLGERSKSYSATDPQKSLEYQKKITAAQRGLASQEITRAGMAIMEGRGTKMDKLNKFSDLARQAYETGDGALYQRLTSAGEALQIQIQNEQYAAGQAAIANGERAGREYEKTVKQQLDMKLNAPPTENSPGGVLAQLEAMKNGLKYGGNTFLGELQNKQGKTYFDAIKGSLEAIAGAYKQAAEATTDPEQKQKWMLEYNKVVNGDKDFQIAPGLAGKGLDFVNKQLELKGNGQDPGRLVAKPDGTFEYATNFTTALKPVRGADGKIAVVQGTNGQKGDFKSTIDALNKGGYDASQAEDGTIKFYNPRTGQTAYGTPDDNGNVIYQEGVDANGNAIVKRFVVKDGKDEAVSQQEIDAQSSPEAQLKSSIGGKDESVNKFLNATNSNKMEMDYRNKALSAIQQFKQLGFDDLANSAADQLKFAAGGGGGLLGLGSPIASLQKKLSELQAEAAVRSQAQADRDFITSNPSAGSVVFKPQNGQVLNPSKAVQAGVSGAKAPAVIQDFLGGGNRFAPTNSFGQTNLYSVGGIDRVKAYSIINNSSNYGGAVSELQKAGYNPSTYDEELRTANNNQGGANKSGITSRFR
jgi:hypothetical protein